MTIAKSVKDVEVVALEMDPPVDRERRPERALSLRDITNYVAFLVEGILELRES